MFCFRFALGQPNTRAKAKHLRTKYAGLAPRAENQTTPTC